MLKKILLLISLATASLQASMFAGINDKGFDFGFGNGKVDYLLQGEFNYLSADGDATAWTLSLSPDIEYLLFHSARFKLYGMSGAYLIYGRYSAAYLNLGYFGDYYDDLQEVTAGVNIFVLRPEAIISKNASIYANLPIFQWERGNQAGQSIWIIGGYTNGSGYLDESAAIGIKFYF